MSLQLVSGVVQNLNSVPKTPETASSPHLLSELESEFLSLAPDQLQMLFSLSSGCICNKIVFSCIALKVPPALICCQFKIVQFPGCSRSSPVPGVCMYQHCVLTENRVLKVSPTSSGSSQHPGAVESFVDGLH